MKLLKIKDNSRIPNTEFSRIEKLTEKIANKNLEQLEREGLFVFPETIKDSENIESDQMLLQSINDTYKSGNLMGFLGYGDERLVIESRFCGDGEDFFFIHLLNRVLDVPNIVDLETHFSQENRVLDILMFLFPYYLNRAARKGLFKKYIVRVYNDQNVKGNIDIVRHIKENTPFVGNVAYSRREFSCDNSLMQLVRHAIEFIKRKPFGKNILMRVKEEVELVVASTPCFSLRERQKVVLDNEGSPVRHSYFREYYSLQKLCLLILRNQRHQIGFGLKRIYGVVIDGAWLWEEYVDLLVKDIFYHPKNRGGVGAQRLFEGNAGLIYPDFISIDRERRIIADAKYKPVNNIGNRDYLQILAYMFRFDAKCGYFLYPEIEGSADVILRMNYGSTYESNVAPRDDVCVVKRGLKIPVNARDYKEFVSRLADQEKLFKCAFLRN